MSLRMRHYLLVRTKFQQLTEIDSMSTPARPGPSTTSTIDDEEVVWEFEKGCGCHEKCYEQFNVS